MKKRDGGISEILRREIIDTVPRRGEKRKSKNWDGGFSGGTVVESLPVNAGDTGSSPGLGGSHMPRSN